jgi:transglutaminase-like putative cysteine protease
MTEMFSVPTNRKAGPGESIVVQLADTAERLDESVSDLYVAAGNKWALRPLPDRCVSSGALPRPSAVKQWLQATVTLQSDHHDIINLSKRLRRNEKDACTLIASFNHYVYTFLEKKPTATFSNALETLHAGYGDCGEHSALLAALLRACGIPARVVLGLLYVEQKKAYFYHSQVMAFSDEWIFADPTWDVCPAHGLFVPLIIDDTGSRAQALSRVIGRIAITYRKDDEKQGP